MQANSFFDRYANMSFGELRKYIDSCLDALVHRRADAKIPILERDDFLKLLDLLRVKADAHIVSPPPVELPKWRRLTREEELAELKRLRKDQAENAQREHSRAEHLRFCERIRRDIERIFMLKPDTSRKKVFWRILPSGEWTVDSVLSHYAELQRENSHIHFDLERLKRMFSLGPSSLYIGLDEFDGYIVFIFFKTNKVVLECPVYGNAIYIIRENWKSLSTLPKGELLARFPSQALRVVHAGDWYTRLQAELLRPKA